ncbi:MAG TPA: hypothetical protein VGW38_04510 [Chloroflexota bacterium]|nr:hypothetical protein [Chloroflexota bacterium]
MFRITGGGASYLDLTATEAASKARSLQQDGIHDVEIFRGDGSRISMYALEQMVRKQSKATGHDG